MGFTRLPQKHTVIIKKLTDKLNCKEDEILVKIDELLRELENAKKTIEIYERSMNNET